MIEFVSMDITYVKEHWKIKVKKGVVTIDASGRVEIAGPGRTEPFVINAPGEYEVEGISVFGYGLGEGQTAYVVQGEEVRVLWLGELSEKISDKLAEELDTIDAAMVATAGGSVKVVTETVGGIEPSYVLPYGETAKVQEFVKHFEHGSRSAEKLSLSRATIPVEATEVVILGNL